MRWGRAPRLVRRSVSAGEHVEAPEVEGEAEQIECAALRASARDLTRPKNAKAWTWPSAHASAVAAGYPRT